MELDDSIATHEQVLEGIVVHIGHQINLVVAEIEHLEAGEVPFFQLQLPNGIARQVTSSESLTAHKVQLCEIILVGFDLNYVIDVLVEERNFKRFVVEITVFELPYRSLHHHVDIHFLQLSAFLDDLG